MALAQPRRGPGTRPVNVPRHAGRYIWRDPGAGPAEDGPGMGIYDFEVLKDDTVIAADQAIALADARAAWPKVAELAKTFNEPGHKIRVRDEAGGIVMLIGVVALRHSANAVSAGVLGVSGAISEVR